MSDRSASENPSGGPEVAVSKVWHLTRTCCKSEEMKKTNEAKLIRERGGRETTPGGEDYSCSGRWRRPLWPFGSAVSPGELSPSLHGWVLHLFLQLLLRPLLQPQTVACFMLPASSAREKGNYRLPRVRVNFVLNILRWPYSVLQSTTASLKINVQLSSKLGEGFAPVFSLMNNIVLLTSSTLSLPLRAVYSYFYSL